MRRKEIINKIYHACIAWKFNILTRIRKSHTLMEILLRLADRLLDFLRKRGLGFALAVEWRVITIPISVVEKEIEDVIIIFIVAFVFVTWLRSRRTFFLSFTSFPSLLFWFNS